MKREGSTFTDVMNNLLLTTKPKRGQTLRIMIVFMCASFIMNLMCNCFSPLYSLIFASDPACFYMEGHAWACGLLPYVDFVDVKGPLLFFIYMLSCLITPNSTSGIFVVHVVASAVNLYIIFLIANLFMKDKYSSMLAALMVIPFIYWRRVYLDGGESEELMMPFLAMLLYSWYSYQQIKSTKHLKLLAYTIGIGAAITLLIKYNCTFPFFVSFILIVCDLCHERKKISDICGITVRVALGFSIILLPFIIWLHTKSILGSCWDVYVTLNFHTYFSDSSIYHTGSGLTKLISYLEMVFREPEGVFMVVSILAGVLYPQPNSQKRKTAIINTILLCSILFCSLGRWHSYYLLFCSPCLIIPICYVLQGFTVKMSWRNTLLIGILIVCVGVRLNGSWLERCPMRVSEKLKGSVLIAENEIGKKSMPKIMYYGDLDRGFGVKAGALPACPEWCTLNGVAATDFEQKQRSAIQRNLPDFIVTLSTWPTSGPAQNVGGKIVYTSEKNKFCEDCGYVSVCSFYDGHDTHATYTLYRRKGEE